MFIPPRKNGGMVGKQLPRIESLSEKQIVSLTQNHSLGSARVCVTSCGMGVRHPC